MDIKNPALAAVWLCVECHAARIDFGHVLDRREGECGRHGEVAEVCVPARYAPESPQKASDERVAG